MGSNQNHVKTGIIYGLYDAQGVLRYIGQTSQPLERRLAQHRSDSKTSSTRVANWIAKHGIPKAEVLEQSDDVNTAERNWIVSLRKAGFDLLNHTEGGEGRVGTPHSPESRRRMSEAQKRRFSDPEERMAQSARLRGLPKPGIVASNKRRRGEKKPGTAAAATKRAGIAKPKCHPGCTCRRHNAPHPKCQPGCTCGRHKGRTYRGI